MVRRARGPVFALALVVGGCSLAWESRWTPPSSPDASSARCGNAIVEPGATCDGNCPASCDDGNPCTIDAWSGSAATCDLLCRHDQLITECRSGDGCCPTGCNSLDDQDCSASCGNKVVEPSHGETCDPPETCPVDCGAPEACVSHVMTGSRANCNVTCVATPIVACVAGDGCCPAGCTHDTDPDCPLPYPSGPYGVDIGDTIYDLCVTECECAGAELTGTRPLCLDAFLEKQATMIVNSAGDCPSCGLLTDNLEDLYYQPYSPDGLDVLVVLFRDPNSNMDLASLTNYCCKYRDNGKMTFHVAVDPDDLALGRFKPPGGVLPLTLLMDSGMVIKYKASGIPSQAILKAKVEIVLGLR